MDEMLAQKLCALNRAFYQAQARSFSDTRQAPWPGWLRCFEEMQVYMKQTACQRFERCDLQSDLCAASFEEPVHVLDVACGNLRFAHYLAQDYFQTPYFYVGLDACDDLVNPHDLNGAVHYQHCDVMAELIEGTLQTTLATCFTAQNLRISPQADLTVLFGFMHHVPLVLWRTELLQALIHATKPRGFVAVSFWRFMDDEGLADKARVTHEQGLAELGFNAADFGAGDYLLGWRNTPGAYRYCHSFSGTEIDELIESVTSDSGSAECIARFRADGRTGGLNEYVILRAQ